MEGGVPVDVVLDSLEDGPFLLLLEVLVDVLYVDLDAFGLVVGYLVLARRGVPS